MKRRKPTIAPFADAETAFWERDIHELDMNDDMTDEEAIYRMRDPEFISALAEYSEAISPDPIGCDHFFLSGFITEEMAMEFPIIARDFLAHVYKDIPSFWVDIYGIDKPKEAYSFSFLNQKILNMIYLAAKGNSENDSTANDTQSYAIALLRNLYRSYHRQEYLVLKRHSSLTVADVFSIAVTSGPSYDDFMPIASTDVDAIEAREQIIQEQRERTEGLFQLASYARILVMSGFLGITLKPECKYIYQILFDEYQKIQEADYWSSRIFIESLDDKNEKTKKDDLTIEERRLKKEAKRLGLVDLPEGYTIPENIMEESRRQVQEWLAECSQDAKKDSYGFENPLSSEKMSPYAQADSFVGDVLNYYGYDKEYIFQSNYHYQGLEMELTKTLALLKWRQPERDHDFAEVQLYSQLMNGADALTGQMDRADEYLDCMFGIDDRYYEWDDNRRRFKPDRIVKPVSEEKVHTTAVFEEKKKDNEDHSVNDKKDKEQLENKLSEEINRLREKTHSQEKQIQKLYSMYSEARDKAAEYQELQVSYDNDRKELQALREHVYKYTEEAQDYDNQDSDDIDAMEKAIAQKKIVIIGGRDSWINKLKAKFSNWRFISTDLSALVDLKVFDGVDYIYFFTEYLSHSTYSGYIKALRERGLPFGYIHSVNIEKNIRQIYEDICI